MYGFVVWAVFCCCWFLLLSSVCGWIAEMSCVRIGLDNKHKMFIGANVCMCVCVCDFVLVNWATTTSNLRPVRVNRMCMYNLSLHKYVYNVAMWIEIIVLSDMMTLRAMWRWVSYIQYQIEKDREKYIYEVGKSLFFRGDSNCHSIVCYRIPQDSRLSHT